MLEEGLVVRWGEAERRLALRNGEVQENFFPPFRKTNLQKPRLVFTYCNFKEEEEGGRGSGSQGPRVGGYYCTHPLPVLIMLSESV